MKSYANRDSLTIEQVKVVKNLMSSEPNCSGQVGREKNVFPALVLLYVENVVGFANSAFSCILIQAH